MSPLLSEVSGRLTRCTPRCSSASRLPKSTRSVTLRTLANGYSGSRPRPLSEESFVSSTSSCSRNVCTPSTRTTFYRQDRSDERTGGVTFVTLGVVFTVVAVIWRSHLVMDIAGGIILVLLVLMLVGYDRLWNVTINQLLKGTTWSLSRWGILVEDTATNVRASNLTRRPRVARMMAGGLKNDDAGEDENQRGSETGVLQ
jgi:hypothetical protein